MPHAAPPGATADPAATDACAESAAASAAAAEAPGPVASDDATLLWGAPLPPARLAGARLTAPGGCGGEAPLLSASRASAPAGGAAEVCALPWLIASHSPVSLQRSSTGPGATGAALRLSSPHAAMDSGWCGGHVAPRRAPLLPGKNQRAQACAGVDEPHACSSGVRQHVSTTAAAHSPAQQGVAVAGQRHSLSRAAGLEHAPLPSCQAADVGHVDCVHAAGAMAGPARGSGRRGRGRGWPGWRMQPKQVTCQLLASGPS